ncbi:DNA mismatch repair protein MutS [Sporosalibacterium faouarense]|uniref:DNA mismatch repair protein MutS n=1 Tax=Sporosalibacterium faouarense TaxID=516123 RepID=UPI00192C06B0|nr:DNA mismatch repair protein MutS [Sporosalibacterium faouarense]
MAKLTPMMQQYMDIKNKNKDSILFFRLGDFYEMFFDDALLASRELEIALTGRECGQEEKAPMCGVPYHSADSYISKLVKKGYNVAICEQVEDPSQAKGIVKRDVVRIITPGTITDVKVLDEKDNNYLCCVYMNENGCGISYVDISTGDLFTTDLIDNMSSASNLLIDELAKIGPTEIIANEFFYKKKDLVNEIEKRFNIVIKKYEDWAFDTEFARDKIKNQLSVISLDGFGLKNRNFAVSSTGALIEYLNETQKTTLDHINNISTYRISNFMVIDINTRRNLELTETMRDKSKRGSLLWVLDKTSTAMGGRLLKKWIQEPLLKLQTITNRLESVETLVNNIFLMDEIKELLKKVYDIERLMGRIAYGNCNARDLIALKGSISIIPELKALLSDPDYPSLNKLANEMDTLEDVHDLIEDSILEDPPLAVKEGGIIKTDYNEDLKALREGATKGKEWLSNLQSTERKRTGIKSLKVGFNKVFGYYLEVTKSNMSLVPDDYIRKQTLANSERYITPELKEMESKILGSEEKMTALEYSIFLEIRNKIKSEIKRIQKTSKIISTIDVLNSLAEVAYKNNYIKPTMKEEGTIDIIGGRHPVVEKMLNDELFVPNDTHLDDNKNRISIITGPNMAGKSTYMRQVALITLMSQIGSFVPAEEANIGIVDKIFTRVGASDNLAHGQSTFMVEMSEVANILNNGTKNSLIILDEIGRGTSTYDGLSIAWSVVEYISEKSKIGAKTLFATHYHELTELEGKIDGVINYKIHVQEKGKDIIFLRKIKRGGADKSYGIEVARLAGVPNPVIDRAKEILAELEKRDINKSEILQECSITKEDELNSKVITPNAYKPDQNEEIKEIDNSEKIEEKSSEFQLDMFNVKEKQVLDKLKNIDMMNVTPLDAINILYELVNKSRDI